MRGFLEGLVGQEMVRPVDSLVPPLQAGGLSDAARPLIGLAASVTARFGGGGKGLPHAAVTPSIRSLRNVQS